MNDIKIDIKEAALRNYRNAIEAINAAEKWAENVTDADVMDDGASSLGSITDRMMNLVLWRREQVDAMRKSFHYEWGILTAWHNDYDGPEKMIFADGMLSFYWSYPKTGYHGGLIFHPTYATDPATGERKVLPVGTWSIHT